MADRRGSCRRRGVAEKAVGDHGGVSHVPSLWLMIETFVLKAPCGTDKGCLRRCQPPWAGSLLFLGKGVRARGCQHPEGCRSPGLSAPCSYPGCLEAARCGQPGLALTGRGLLPF